MRRKERFSGIIEWFKVNMPIAESELHYTNPYELLVAVILSAQCTDKRVNMVTPALFAAFPTPQKLADTTVEEIFEYVKSISYPNNKARNLHKMAVGLLDMFDGEVPSEVDDLVKLAGVGRKTANVIASVIFNKPAMAVDTHVFRVSERIGLTLKSKNPLQTERELVKHIPSELLPIAHHWLILHGRYVCTARNPQCESCGIAPWCKSFKQS